MQVSEYRTQEEPLWGNDNSWWSQCPLLCAVCTQASRVESKSFVYHKREIREDNNSRVLACLDMPGAEITSSHYPLIITLHITNTISSSHTTGKPVLALKQVNRAKTNEIRGRIKQSKSFTYWKMLGKLKPKSLAWCIKSEWNKRSCPKLRHIKTDWIVKLIWFKLSRVMLCNIPLTWSLNFLFNSSPAPAVTWC